MEPTHRRGAKVVEAILEAARAELGAAGYADLTIEAVATRAGVNKTTVYRRFPTKGDLIAEALRRELETAAPDPDTGDLRADLLALARFTASFLRGPSGKALALAVAGGQLDEQVLRVVRELRLRTETAPARALRSATLRGELPPGADALTMLDLIAGAVQHRLTDPHAKISDADLQRIVDVAVTGTVAVAVRAAVPSKH